MDFLVAAISIHMLVIILEVAFALGMVIFVHELGHFVVAKLCGVKCEKFYLGFDIYGLKLLKFKWGETEYGIGILPLGGYVKMLGQDDNPGRAAEERERSQLQTEVGAQPQLDPRSYLAQSVPRRMAIISAGVIMNVIFALVTAVLAFRLGVPDASCKIGMLFPGEAGWRAGLQPGDEVVEIEGKATDRTPTFSDLQEVVRVGDIDRGVRFKIKRPGIEKPFWLTIQPDRIEKNRRLAPTIGAAPLASTSLIKAETPVKKHSLAERMSRFMPGDQIVSVSGNPVPDYPHVLGRLYDATFEPRKPVVLTVERLVREKKSRFDIPVPDNPMRTLGLVMQMGPVVAVQEGSPAAEAGLRTGDRIRRINGRPAGDPLKLPRQFHALAGKPVVLTVARDDTGGKEINVDIRVPLRKTWWYERPLDFGSPLSIPELGLAYNVDSVIASASDVKYADGRAERLKAGDEIVKAEIVPTRDKGGKIQEQAIEPIEFSSKKPNWVIFASGYLQSLLPSTKLQLTLAGGKTVLVQPFDSTDWFNPDIGLIPEVEMVELRGATWREAFDMGARKTKDALLLIYSFLDSLRTGQVSVFGLGGPVAIATQAGSAASEGLPTLLLFLTMLSANLAVINFLPIPLLDGGHMVFLILEGIRGKPVSERIVVAFHYAGFLFIISLMLFVLSLDLGLISRHAQ